MKRANVVISATGSGKSYTRSTTLDVQGEETPFQMSHHARVESGETEWNSVEVTFTWEAGAPALTSSTVTVSFHPQWHDDDDTRVMPAGPTMDVVTVERMRHVAAVPVRDQHVRLRYRNRHYEYFGG